MDAADDPMNYLKEYKRIYNTPGPATTAYKEHLKTIHFQRITSPVRELVSRLVWLVSLPDSETLARVLRLLRISINPDIVRLLANTE